jgi:hypothetical protein
MPWRRLAEAALALGMLAACASVEPWRKGQLAQPGMALDRDALQRQMSTHVYESKEASRASEAAGGGGCGCR